MNLSFEKATGSDIEMIYEFNKYLIDRGIKNIDKIIISHFDSDHCGGVVDLIKDRAVKNELNLYKVI